MKKIYLSLIAIVFAINFSYAQWTGGPTGPVYYNGGNVGIGTASPNGVFHIHNNVAYGDNATTQLILTNGGYRSSESGTLPVDNAGMAFYFTNYNAGGKFYDRTLDIRVRGAGDGTFGAGMIRFFANDYTSGSVEREIMRIHGSGNVGIGITSPLGLLSLKNQISNGYDPVNYPATNGVVGQAILNSYYVFNSDGSGQYPRYLDIASIGEPDGTHGGGNIRFLTNPIASSSPAVERMRISSNGNVGIGTTDTKGYTFAVNGTAIATSMTVKLYSAWPDYVFKPTYHLPSLTEVKTYIDQNHHLPDMPSEQEVAKDGINLGEMNKVLTKKMEELTLYLIEKDNKDKEKDIKLQSQQQQINQLKEQLATLIKALTKD